MGQDTSLYHYLLSIPMVVMLLDVEKDPYRPKRENEDVLGPETSYLSAISALLYLSIFTRPSIAFAMSCLARHSSKPTKRH